MLQDGVFFAATQLYGMTFTERPDLVAYHPDARIFEVANADGTAVGLYVLDLYTRDSKRGGAWMNSLISQSGLLRHPVVVVNNLNVPKPAAGKPTLLTLDEVSTLFHEFGHALHGLFARVTYPKFAGTNVFRDFVEFPSQVNEMWMLWPEMLDNYAKHHETGEPLDAGVVESSTRPRRSTRASRRASTSPPRCSSRRGTPSPRRRRGRDRRRRVRGGRARRRRARQPRRPHPLLEHLLRARVLRRLQRRVLLLHLERGARRRHRQVVQGERRSDARERRPVPVALLGVGGSKDPLEAYREFRGRDGKKQQLLNAGAAHVVVTDDEDLTLAIKEFTGGAGVRLAFDPVAGPGVEEIALSVVPGGRLVVYGALDPRQTPLPNAQSYPALSTSTYTLFEVTTDPQRLARAVAFVNSGLVLGVLDPVIDRVFDLEDIAAAHRHMESNTQVGKIVVTVRHEH